MHNRLTRSRAADASATAITLRCDWIISKKVWSDNVEIKHRLTGTGFQPPAGVSILSSTSRFVSPRSKDKIVIPSQVNSSKGSWCVCFVYIFKVWLVSKTYQIMILTGWLGHKQELLNLPLRASKVCQTLINMGNAPSAACGCCSLTLKIMYKQIIRMKI